MYIAFLKLLYSKQIKQIIFEVYKNSIIQHFYTFMAQYTLKIFAGNMGYFQYFTQNTLYKFIIDSSSDPEEAMQ